MTTEIQLMAISDVALALECSASHVRNLIDRGELPAARDTRGRRLCFVSTVEKYKAEREKAKGEKKNGGRKLKLKFRVKG